MSLYDEDRQPYPRTAGEDLDAYLLVKDGTAGTAGKLIKTAAKGDKPLGLHYSRAALAGKQTGLIVSGVHKAVAAGAIAMDAELMPAAAGRVATHDAATGSYFVGRAMQAAAAAGDVIDILVYDRMYPKPA